MCFAPALVSIHARWMEKSKVCRTSINGTSAKSVARSLRSYWGCPQGSAVLTLEKNVGRKAREV